MLKPAFRRRRVLATITAAVTATIAIVAATVVLATPASAATSWLAVSAGRLSTCAINSNHDLYCWGGNYDGQLGLGHLNSTPIPSRVPAGNSDWATVSVGNTHACATRTNGKGYCWGANTLSGDGITRNGKLGLGDSVYIQMSPTQLPGAWASVSASVEHTCGIHSNGRLLCWGDGRLGALGQGNEKTYSTPTYVGTWGWDSVSTGVAHTCAYQLSDIIYCWGSTNTGQVGTGIMATEDDVSPTVPSPDYVRPLDRKWNATTVGGKHSCGIERTGLVWCWGQNRSGQLGLGHTTDKSTPQQISGSAGDYSDWTTITAGHNHTCAIRSNGHMNCWGENGDGQLGLDHTNDRSYATKVVGSTWASVDGGTAHTCAIRSNGWLYCWGDNSWGQLGLGGGNDRLTPTRIP